jgi:hypothetical protein
VLAASGSVARWWGDHVVLYGFRDATASAYYWLTMESD